MTFVASQGRRARILLLYADAAEGRLLSYWAGWPRHFVSSPLFETIALNVGHAGWWPRLRNMVTALTSSCDGIVVLHSVYSNQRHLGARLARVLAAMDKPTAIFLANEYKLMPDKMAFCEELGVDLLVSQSHSPAIHQLYEERLKCRVMFLPNGGLDEDVFKPEIEWTERPIDVGFRAYEVPWYLGHDEKTDLARAAVPAAARAGLVADVSTDPKDRFDERGWAKFLNRCKAVLGAEAGTDYFELTDRTREVVNAFVAANPQATRDEVIARFFQNYENPVSGRMLASRHIEAGGTKTLQLLIEGEYGGVLRPDVHYVPLARDLSNLPHALEKIRDTAYCQGIIERTYAVVRADFTYAKLIERFFHQFAQLMAR